MRSAHGGTEPPALPTSLRRALAATGADLGTLVPPAPGGRPRPVRRLLGEAVVVDVAADEEGRRLVLLEVRGRAWARAHGVPVPDVLAADPGGGWLVGRRVPPATPSGTGYVAAAVAAARRVEAAPPPRGGPPASAWRAPRRTRAVRAARLLREPAVDLTTFRRVRAAALALPRTATAHGDFYFRNVLAAPADDAGRGVGVAVVDWEHLAPAPPRTDLLRLWTTTKDDADRAAVLEAALAGLDRSALAVASVLGHWLALRLLAENVTAPRSHRRAEDAAHARRVVPEAARLAAVHGHHHRA